LPLERDSRTYVCSRGHSYDVARSGYVNLLQPQDRRSLSAGDSPSAIEARARLLKAGIGRGIVDAFVRRAATLDLRERALVADLGSGSGDALAALALARPITGVGIDLSTVAVEHAARRFPAVTWAVANADRRLPFLDNSVALVLSLHARRHAVECARVLAPTGFLLVAVPAPEDLVELRALVQGEGSTRPRADALLAEHQHLFTLIERFSVRERHTLHRASLVDLLRGTYRGARTSASDRVDALTTLDVTLASEVLLFAQRPSALARSASLT
jgi:23S rRNA (guanine745-N1)-methyltransferase